MNYLSGAFLKHSEKNSNIGMQNLNHVNKEFGEPKARIVDNKAKNAQLLLQFSMWMSVISRKNIVSLYKSNRQLITIYCIREE